MGGPLADSSTKGVSSSLCLCHNTCEQAVGEHKSCACRKDENLEAGITGGEDDFVVEETGTALAEVMHVYDDEDHNDDRTDLGEDSENDDSVSPESDDSSDDLVDIDTEVVISSVYPSGHASESSIGKSDDRKASTNDTPMLVSAMKGSRAKRGIIAKLSVSWDPDVYDPPVTSESHTVKAHQRSSRKGHYKYKSSRSSSSSNSRSNSSKRDKNHSRHSSSSSSKRDKKHSYRSTTGGRSSSSSSRIDTSAQYIQVYGCSTSMTDTGAPQFPKVDGDGSSITTSSVPQYSKASTLVPAKSASLAEAVRMLPTKSASPAEVVPVLKSMEQIKRSTSCCKEQPLGMLSRHFVATKYKGMFSLWSQNQLAS